MGYQTDFIGSFEFEKELTAGQVKELQDFNNERHGGNTEAFEGMPGFWCQWTASDDGKFLEWDGGEKFYNYIEWLEYLLEHFIVPWGNKLNGEVQWEGEESGDLGKIKVVNNTVTVYEGQVSYEPTPPPTINNHMVWLAMHDALTKLGLKHQGGGDSATAGFEDEYTLGDYKVTIEMRN